MATKKKARVSVLQQLESNPLTSPKANLGAFLRAFLEYSLSLAPENESDNWDIDEIQQPTLDSFREQCEQFLAHCYANGYLSEEVDTELMSQAGYDFAAERNGVGVGFRDRGDLYGENNEAEKMAALCGHGEMFTAYDVERYRRKINFAPLYNIPTQREQYRLHYNPEKYQAQAREILGDKYNENLAEKW